MALCCATSVTSPLWAQTEWADPVVKISDFDLEKHEGTQQFYIYHPATGQFVTNGNEAGTQLSVGTTGQMITLEWGAERPPLYNSPVTVTGEGWKLNMLQGPTNSGFHEIFVRDATSAFVDANAQGHMLWQILPQGNQLYRIKIVDQDTSFGLESGNTVTMNGVWGVIETSTVIYPFADLNGDQYAGAEMDWQFVTPEDYDAYQARLDLKPMLEEARDLGFDDELGEYTALYNNQSATSEDLEAAIAGLPMDIILWQTGGASETSPANFTPIVANADFADNGNGWTLTNMNNDQHRDPADLYEDPEDATHFLNYFLEAWVGSGSAENPASVDEGRTVRAEQALTGLPAGVYRLTADCFGVMQATVSTSAANGRGVYLFAGAKGLEMIADAHTLEFYGDNNDRPVPRPVSVEFYSPDGTMTIGFKAENSNCNWVGFDNVKLEYLGEGSGDMTMGTMLQTVVDNFETQIQGYRDNNLVWSAAGEQRASELLETAKAAITVPESDDSLASLGNALQAEMVALQADVDAYTRLNTFLNEDAMEYFNGEYGSYALEALNNYLMGLTDELGNLAFDPADIDSVEIIADSLYQVGVELAITQEGATAVTGMGVNMDFTGSANGWTKTGASKLGYGNNTGEVFRQNPDGGFEVYQEITGLPSGSYKVTAQAFYRPAGYADASKTFDAADPQADVTAYLDVNGARTKIHSLFEVTFDSSEGMAGRFATISDSGTELDGKLVADDLASAEAVLTAGDRTNYEVSVTGYVGEDGVLRFGIIADATSLSSSWCLFDNFRVEYMPGDMTGMEFALQSKRSQAEAMMTADIFYTDESETALLTAIQNATNALDGGLTDETFVAANNGLDEAITLATETDETVKSVETWFNEYDEVLAAIEAGDDKNNYDPEKVADLEGAVAAQTDYVDKYEIYADLAEVNQAILDMNNAYGAMVQSLFDFANVSKEDSTDVSMLLRNPRLQKVVSGVDQSSHEYWEHNPALTNENATADSLFEYFNTKEFDFHQTVYNLPQGYYSLFVSSFYRYGDMTPAGVARRDGEEQLFAQVYATTEEKDYFTPIVSIYEHVMDAKFTSSSAVLPDSLFTYMEPQAYYCVANAVDDANVAFNFGFYRNEVSFYVKEGGSVQLGIRKADGVTNDWCPFDDFSLIYWGDGDENAPTAVDDVISENAAIVLATEWYTIDGMRVAEPKKGGIYIRVNKMSDGSKKAMKVMVK